jgi:hypothetical protein
MMPSPVVCSTPPSQKGSSRNTTKLSSHEARMSRAPRWRNFAATLGRLPVGWRRAKESGRQKPTRMRKSGAPTAMLA